jgi:inositol hexakisphosphate/diphosphoinositol-pentakisphosphate kinase
MNVRPFLVNELEPQYLLHDRRKVYEVFQCLLLHSIECIILHFCLYTLGLTFFVEIPWG